jgi:hypothetical protein
MSCHEIAALRLSLMKVLGVEDEAERQHELAELGPAALKPGPVAALCEAPNFARIRMSYEAALAQLEEKVASTAADDPKLPYFRSLVILTKKVELDLRSQEESLMRFYRDLETMHDFVHECYPAKD